MIFVDASVFVHAYLKPRRALTAEEIQIKSDAKKIVSRLNEGEKVLTSIVHFSEIANLLEGNLPRKEALEIERALCFRDTIEIASVNRRDCVEGLSVAEESGIGLADAIAQVLMKRNGIDEIYSFDQDFDKVPSIKRLRK